MDEKYDDERLLELRERAENDRMARELAANRRKRAKRKATVKEIVSTVIYLGIVFVVTFLVVTFVGQRTEVNGSSMYPTLSDKDNLIVEKVSYKFTSPERYDIIVFPYEDEYEKSHYIKRVIGLPGETVQIIDGYVHINGQVLDEEYGADLMANPGVAKEPVTLGDDEYFVLGDNRNNSKDSRFESVGNIHKSDIVGRAWVRIWPLNKFGFLKHQ